MSTKSVMDTSLTGRRRNRSWPDALRREIVEAALAPGASVSMVARRFDVNANQVFRWRKLYREGGLLPAGGNGPAAMLPVTITADRDYAAGSDETIEITLASGYRVRVGRGVDAAALQRVLDVLERR